MINNINIRGRLGRDPEVTEKDGKNGPFKIARFSVAVDRAFGDETDWFNCEVIGKRADVIGKFFMKGQFISLVGSMESYKTKDDRIGWRVKVSDFDLPEFGDKGETKKSAPKDSFEDIDEDVPF